MREYLEKNSNFYKTKNVIFFTYFTIVFYYRKISMSLKFFYIFLSKEIVNIIEDIY